LKFYKIKNIYLGWIWIFFGGVFFSNFVYLQEELIKFGLEVKEEVVENDKNPTIFGEMLEPIVLYIW
jgi:hypothetical protein